MKFYVTPELAVLIKTLRTQNRVPAKELAEHIEKSYSYVSKLESGDVKNITKDDLTDIFTYICGGGDFYEDVFPVVYRTLKSFLEKVRILEQLWFVQYDVMDRIVRIPENMADEIIQIYDSLNITPKKFAEILNKNEDSELPESVPSNQIILLDNNGVKRFISRMFITPEQIENIVLKRDLQINYGVLQSFLFILYRLHRYPNLSKKLPPDEATDILRTCAELVSKYNVQSLCGYIHFISSEEYTKKNRNAVSSLNNLDTKAIMNVIDIFTQAAKHDAMTTAVALDTMTKNMDWDAFFTFRVLQYKFYELGNISYTNKKKLSEEIEEIIEKYLNMSDFERKYETY